MVGLIFGTTPLVAGSFLLGLVAAWFAYGAARRFEATAGVAAWHIPALLWALLFLLSWLLGLVLFLIARATTHPRTRTAPVGSPVATMATVRAPDAGWYPDPGARHEQRYWDGRGWTDYIRDRGVQGTDPG